MTRPLALLLAGLAVPAAAQTPPPVPANGAVSALRNHNSNAPVDVEADRIEVQDRADRALFSGNVRAKQAELNLSAQRLTVAYAKAPAAASAGAAASTNVQIQRLDASGNVVVQSPTETATGNFAIYDLPRRLITMLGAVTLTRGANVVHGGRLVMDLNTGRATVDGSAVGGAGGVSSGRGGRVTGRFTVANQPSGQ